GTEVRILQFNFNVAHYIMNSSARIVSSSSMKAQAKASSSALPVVCEKAPPPSNPPEMKRNSAARTRFSCPCEEFIWPYDGQTNYTENDIIQVILLKKYMSLIFSFK